MLIPDSLARKITADFRAEKKYGGRKNFCDALPHGLRRPMRTQLMSAISLTIGPSNCNVNKWNVGI